MQGTGLAAKNYTQYSSETRNYKKFQKRSLPNVYRDGALAEKYTNKESTFHNIDTFHTTIPT